MAQWFSNLWGTGQTQTKPQNPSTDKTQLIDDQLMQSMDCSTSSQQNPQKQPEIPQQLESHSSNSSGFQQIIIPDCRSPQKTQNQTNPKPRIPKSNVKINLMDLNQSMNFDEDLNQSISDNAYKYIKQSNIAENDLMNFSYKSANEQSFSGLSNGASEMEDSFSNLRNSVHKANRQSFSDLQVSDEKVQAEDLLRITQKPEDDSDMQDDEQTSKMKRSQKAQDQVDDNLSIWGISSRKPSYTDNDNIQSISQSNRQSFSELDDGYEKPINDHKKDIEYEIKMEQSQNGEKQQEQIDLTELEKSIVAPTIQTAFNKKNLPKSKNGSEKSPVKTKLQFTPQKNTQQVKHSAQIINMGDSFVMSPVQQQPKKKTLCKQSKNLKNKPQNLLPFYIHSKDYVHFIRYGKTEDRLLSQKLLQSITQFFLVQNIMLPIFNIKLIQDVETEMALQRKEVKMSLFTLCINLYFSYLDKKYPGQMRRFFDSQQSSKSLKSQVGIPAKKQENSAIFATFYKKMFDYLKLNHYSKAEILKKTLEAQLAFVSEYKQTWLQSWSDSDPNMEQSFEQKQFTKRNSLDMQSVRDKELFLLKKIAELEVLISFEKSEMYCEEKLKEKMEENIWKERKRKLIEDRNFFITELYPCCFV